MPPAPSDRLIVDGESFEVEVLESLVRTYLVRPRSLDFGNARLVRLPSGTRLQLAIGGEPPVRCRLSGDEDGALRLIRGWGLS